MKKDEPTHTRIWVPDTFSKMKGEKYQMQKLSEEAKRRKNDYIIAYKKKNYKKITIEIKPEEFEELEKILLENGWNKPEFIRQAIKKLK